ncbi:MAG: von Willebrand factor type A domain-containing protein [Verrucomicrobia bacterium]|nr:MAG: von Willebrand factor type A domain-containing protein [Verrucomicrobiota bacterium]
MTTLSFSGDWPPLLGLSVSILVSFAAYLLYKVALRGIENPKARALPWLRAGAVFLVLLMLTGPVLRHRSTSGALTRLLVFVDASQSMSATDPEMDLVRKMAAARALGWLPASQASSNAEAASEELSSASHALRNALSGPPPREHELHAALDAFSKHLSQTLQSLRQGTLSNAEADDLNRQLVAPVKKMLPRYRPDSLSSITVPKECFDLVDLAARWQINIAQKARKMAVIESGGERKIEAALARFDQTTRMERVRSLLLDGGESSLISRLSANFNINLFALENSHARNLWSSTDGAETQPSNLPPPDATLTNIGSSLLERVDAARSSAKATLDSRTAVLLFTDGQHNDSSSPETIAKKLGDRGVPIYCIGIGSETRPPDLALLGIDAPQTIFHEDRVSGTATLKDDMPAGIPFQIKISLGDNVVWQKDMLTSQRSVLKVPFDFSLKDLVAEKIAANPSLKSLITLPLEASLTVLPQERETRNNSSRFIVRATTGKRKLLLLDGRPRWETRYIRSLFERDPQWQVNSLLAEPDGKTPWLRGLSAGAFPADEQTLSEYDMIIFGDVPPAMLSDVELQWISDFISKKGGGLLFLDGARQMLSSYGNRPLSRLLPVTFPTPEAGAGDSAIGPLELTERGRSFAALKLEENASDPAEVWKNLPPPRHLSRAVALPGTETLLESQTPQGRSPVLVFRQYGSGHIAYMASDETWRWRNEIAGKYQERFWSQLVNELAEATFSTLDDQIALDTDSFSYSPGLTAALRARIRDGKPRTSLEATLWRDGKRYASVHLLQEPSRADTFAGRSAPLEPGIYDFGVEDSGGPSKSTARVRFEVRLPQTGELSELTLKEEMLVKMAETSQGKYLREEQTADLLNHITPLKAGQVYESETLLWQSYWWFSPIILLLGLEWILRKRIGLL